MHVWLHEYIHIYIIVLPQDAIYVLYYENMIFNVGLICCNSYK